MKTLATMQFKGGVGKTTTLFALTSAAVSRGQRVVLFDTDQNGPMQKWMAAAKARENWSDLVTVETHMDYQNLFDAAVASQDRGDVDYLMIDPRAGRSEFLVAIAQLVDVLILPTRPVKVDADALIETVSLLKKMEKNGERVAPFKVLFSSIKTDSQLSAGHVAYRDLLEQKLPTFATRLHERVIYQNMQANGLLGSIASSYRKSDNALERRQAVNYETAMKEAAHLLDEIDALALVAEDA